MKYTVSDSTLQYKVGLTLSFLSLISRGVGGIQKGNTSIYIPLRLNDRFYGQLAHNMLIYCQEII